MDFRTKILYIIYRNRLKVIDSYANKAEEIQNIQLKRILKNAENSKFAKNNSLTANMNYEAFRKNVSVNDYESQKALINDMTLGKEDILINGNCKFFAKSSGTTNDKSKFIPVPKIHLKSCHYQGTKDVVALYLVGNPNSRLGEGKSLILGGSHSPINLNSKSIAGDLSAILVSNMPKIGEFLRVPSSKTLLMNEWNAKMEQILKEVNHKDVRSLSGVPSWILVLLKRLLEQENKQYITDIWSNLEVFFHGGISFEPYRQIYQELIPSDKMHYMETYNASEGFFAIQNDLSDDSMLLMLDYGVFYEFIELDKLNENESPIANNLAPVPLWQVEKGKTYAMLISTLGGLYRYLIGDTVIFTSTNPYKIKINGRTKQYINTFGEELMVANTEKAISLSSKQLGVKVIDYTVAPYLISGSERGRHDWIIEFEDNNIDINKFADTLDENLKNLNSDYEAKRYSNMTLERLEIKVAPKGFFEKWLDSKGKLGGQHKVPRLANNRKFMDSMLELLEK